MPTIAILAAMSSELVPVRSALRLRPTRAVPYDYTGDWQGLSIGAAVTGMGLAAAEQRAAAVFAAGEIDHLFVVGVAGGLDPDIGVGELVTAAQLEDERDGRAYFPAVLGGIAADGVLLGSNRLHYSEQDIAALRARGVRAVDMESAAIAAVCARHGCPCSVYRAISDPVLPGGQFEELYGLAREDGSPDLGAALRYLARRPWRLPALAAMGLGSRRAICTASAALLRDLAAFPLISGQ